MRHLLNAAAVATALALAVPAWAQNPSGGNSMGVPGPSPGGPGLTPYSAGAPSAAVPMSAAPAPTPPFAAAAQPANSAAPSMHSHGGAARGWHHKMAHRGRLNGDTTAQLNRHELARIRSGELSNPAAPPSGAPGRGQ